MKIKGFQKYDGSKHASNEWGMTANVFRKTVCGRYYVCLETGEAEPADQYEKRLAGNGHWFHWEGELEDGTKIALDSRVPT